MADSFQFELVSPERLLLSERATAVNAPGTEGYFTVMANHAPMMATLRPGVVAVTLENGQERSFFVMGGFADVGSGGLTLLAESARPVEDVKAEDLDREIERAEARLSEAPDDNARFERADAVAQLRTARAQMAA